MDSYPEFEEFSIKAKMSLRYFLPSFSCLYFVTVEYILAQSQLEQTDVYSSRNVGYALNPPTLSPALLYLPILKHRKPN